MYLPFLLNTHISTLHVLSLMKVNISSGLFLSASILTNCFWQAWHWWDFQLGRNPLESANGNSLKFIEFLHVEWRQDGTFYIILLCSRLKGWGRSSCILLWNTSNKKEYFESFMHTIIFFFYHFWCKYSLEDQMSINYPPHSPHDTTIYCCLRTVATKTRVASYFKKLYICYIIFYSFRWNKWAWVYELENSEILRRVRVKSDHILS